MALKNHRFIAILVGIAVLLMVPFVAMFFTDEVDWSPSDFIIAGGLLLTTGLACELILRRVTSRMARIVACLVVLAALFVIWVELAVGIFGSPFAGN
jgi:hypothetical protein